MRIARDLHDSVIQELFAAGLTLAGIEASVGAPFDETITEVIERLDGGMRRLREAVFGLHGRRGARDIPILVKEAGRILGFEPDLTVVGDEVEMPDALWGDIDKVIRECLTNVARHSGATEASVRVSLTPDEVTVKVTDNGRGLEGRSESGTGFRSLEERAATRGGVLEVGESAAGGATISWRVPVDASAGG
jgi:signal transduction histidine kinase